MANATSLPAYTDNKFFFWNAKLTNSLDNSTSAQTIEWDTVPVDENGATITGSFLIACRNTRRNPNRTEMMWVPASAVAADGLSATNVVRGLKPSGIDFTTGSSSYVYEFDSGDEIFCAILPQDGELLRAAVQGLIQTGGIDFIMGAGSAATVTHKRATGSGTSVGWLRWDTSTEKVQFSNAGVVWTNLDSVSASDLVAASSADTTPGYLNDKIDVATAGRLTKSIGNPAGNETIRLTLATTLTDAEMNAIHTGISGNVTGTNLATLTAGAASNADALHTHSGLTTSITAGEAIDGSTVAKPIALTGNNFKGVIIAPGTGFIIMNNTAGTTRAVGDVDARAKRGQSFTITDSLATSITLESITIMLEVAGSPADYCTLEISEDSGGFPSSTIIANGTATPIQGSSLTTDARPQKFTFATPPTLTSGTTYWFALRRSTVGGGASALDAANYYSMFDAGANVITGNSAVYTASTLTWGSSTTTDFQFVLQYNRDYDAKALITDGDSLTRTRFKGFTRSNVAGGGSIALATSGSIGGLTLTPGADYYLDTTQGALTATAPSPTTTFNGLVPVIRVGTAANSTDLIIDPSFEALLVTSFSNGGLTQAGSQPDANLDVFIETGFTPREFELRYEINNVAGTGTDDRFIVSKYIRTTQASVFQMTTSGFATFAGISSTASTYLSIQAIYENGFLLRIFTTDTSEILSNVQIFIKS